MTPRNNRLLHCLILMVAILMISGGFIYFQFSVLSTPDSFDYAQLARNIAEEGRFTTKIITPISWSKVPQFENHPDLWRAPIYPILIALGFHFFGVNQIILLLVSTVCFMGFACLFYRLTERIYTRQAAFLSTCFLITTPVLSRASFTGFAESAYLLLVLASVLVVFWNRDHPGLLGVLSALALLTRYNHCFFLVGILYGALRGCNRRKLNYAIQFVLTLTVFLTPWFLRNYLIMGKPLYHHHYHLLASHNPIFKQFEVFFTFEPPGPYQFALSHPEIMIEKWFRNILTMYQWIPRFVKDVWIVIILSLVELINSWNQDNQRRQLILIFLVGFIVQVFFLSFVHMKSRHYLPFLPVLLIFAGPAVCKLGRKFSFPLEIGIAVILLGINLAVIIQLNPWPQEITSSDYKSLKEYIPKNEPVLTNSPELTAWYSNRKSLWLAPYEQVKKFYPEFDYVLLTPEIQRNYSPQITIESGYLKNKMFRSDFRLLKRFPVSNARLYVRKIVRK